MAGILNFPLLAAMLNVEFAGGLGYVPRPPLVFYIHTISMMITSAPFLVSGVYLFRKTRRDIWIDAFLKIVIITIVIAIVYNVVAPSLFSNILSEV